MKYFPSGTDAYIFCANASRLADGPEYSAIYKFANDGSIIESVLSHSVA